MRDRGRVRVADCGPLIWGDYEAGVSEKLRTAVIIVGMILAAVASYTAARLWQEDGSAYQRTAVVSGCDLEAGPCQQTLGGGEISFSITPRPIPLMRTLTLAVGLSGVDAAAVVVEIRGLNMDMGLNRVRLQRDGSGVWRGETILPVCSQRRMEWEAAVRLDSGSGYEIPFLFNTTRP